MATTGTMHPQFGGGYPPMDADVEGLQGPQDYLAVVKRRKWHILVPAVLLSLVSALVAFLLPPVYRSEAIILIEQPAIPPELMASTITSYAEERIQIITQRVTTTQNLTQIIDKLGLYAEERKHLPLSAVIATMRENLRVEFISARSGKGADATIAFKVAFEHEDAGTAQRIASELVSLYLSENARTRQQKAAETAAFLSGEVVRLEREIVARERDLSELKQRHAASLPTQLAYNLQMLASTEGALRALDQRRDALEERVLLLRAQLEQISPYQAFTLDGGLSVAERLRALRSELIALSARYKPEHPTLVQLRSEIAELEKAVGGGSGVRALEDERERLQAELAVARQRGGQATDDLEARLARVEAELSSARREGGGRKDGLQPDNPLYLQIEAEIQTAEREIAAIPGRRAEFEAVLAGYRRNIEATPVVEREMQGVLRSYDNARHEYQAIKAKQMAADWGETIETERKGERFSLLEPPAKPEKPIKPNRPAILMLGLVLSIGAGAGLAFLAEMMDQAIHGARSLAAIVGAAPLVSVPYIRTRAEVRRIWRRRLAVAAGASGALAGLVVATHLYYSPLDVLWARVERRLETTLGPVLGG